MRNKHMPNCDRCENYFCSPTEDSPCAACLKKESPNGFKPARLIMQIRIWVYQVKLVMRGRP